MAVALILIALLIILVGVPYTILLFLWQWLVRAPEWKVVKWTKNTMLHTTVTLLDWLATAGKGGLVYHCFSHCVGRSSNFTFSDNHLSWSDVLST